MRRNYEDYKSTWMMLFCTIVVRSLPEEEYKCTIKDETTRRIFCVTCGQSSNGNLRLITGGLELKVWEKVVLGGQG